MLISRLPYILSIVILVLSGFHKVKAQKVDSMNADTISPLETDSISTAGDSDSFDQPSEEIFNVTEFSLSSPRSTIGSHLLFLQKESYNDTLSSYTLTNEKLDGGFYSRGELIDLAQKLKEIYDGSGFYVELADIPDHPNYVDSVDSRPIYRINQKQFPQIFLIKRNNQWLYSQQTVTSIDNIHRKIYPLGSDFLRKNLPSGFRKTLFGLELWQYIGILLVLFLTYILYSFFRNVSSILIKKLIPLVRDFTAISVDKVEPVANAASLLIVAVIASTLIPQLTLPPEISAFVVNLFKVIIPLLIIVVLFRLIDLIAMLSKGLASKTDTTMDDQLIPLLKKLIKFVIGTFGIIFILGNIGVDVTALLAGVSIGGLAVALAAQDTVKNLIGSLTIFVDQPFKIGEFIVTDKVTGSVEEVGIRSTRIRALDGATVSIPNGELANLTVTNHSIRTYRRYSTDLTVSYDTTPEKMEQFVADVKEIINTHPKTRTQSTIVHFYEMGDSALKIFVAIISELTDYGEWLLARQEIFLAIMRKAEELGISFAFPSSSIYVESLPEQLTGNLLNGKKSEETDSKLE